MKPYSGYAEPLTSIAASKELESFIQSVKLKQQEKEAVTRLRNTVYVPRQRASELVRTVETSKVLFFIFVCWGCGAPVPPQ